MAWGRGDEVCCVDDRTESMGGQGRNPALVWVAALWVGHQAALGTADAAGCRAAAWTRRRYLVVVGFPKLCHDASGGEGALMAGMHARYWMGAKEGVSRIGGRNHFSLASNINKDPHMMLRGVRMANKQASQARRLPSHYGMTWR